MLLEAWLSGSSVRSVQADPFHEKPGVGVSACLSGLSPGGGVGGAAVMLMHLLNWLPGLLWSRGARGCKPPRLAQLGVLGVLSLRWAS